jgi:hypothetical protein
MELLQNLFLNFLSIGLKLFHKLMEGLGPSLMKLDNSEQYSSTISWITVSFHENHIQNRLRLVAVLKWLHLFSKNHFCILVDS